MKSLHHCHICRAQELELLSEGNDFFSVTSDCKPWLAKSGIGICRSCGGIQKVIDFDWELELKKIYQTYEIYVQSDGIEQQVFQEDSVESPRSRSVCVCEFVQENINISKMGRLLDIGCGNGAWLRTFNKIAPQWLLNGVEIYDKYRPVVESISKNTVMYTCLPEDVPGLFNIISMIHVLEHVVNPKKFLLNIRNKLYDNGLIIIEIPDIHQNPFDFLIIDHCTHFNIETLKSLIEETGFEIIDITSKKVPKELTLIAKKTSLKTRKTSAAHILHEIEYTKNALSWLNATLKKAQNIAKKGKFGLFGTSIAANWLFGNLKDVVQFFVDEDPYRIGKTNMGLPIYHPHEVPKRSSVFIALPSGLAENIKKRMNTSKEVKFDGYTPPPFLNFLPS